MTWIRVRNDISVATFTRIIDSIRAAGFCFDIFINGIQVLDFSIFVSDLKEAEDIVSFVDNNSKFPRNSLKVVRELE